MIRDIAAGLVAGAVGTVALNITTYLDMTVRARPSSRVPAKVAGALSEKAGIALAPNNGKQSEQIAEHRKTGLGALMGYTTGLGVGLGYGVINGIGGGSPPLAVAASGLGLAAMASSDVPAVSVGATDPRTWGASGWASDIVPHLVYGLATALTFQLLRQK